MPHPTYLTLATQFRALNEAHASAILSHQYAWEDFFAQSIYQAEVKDGTIKIYYEPKEIPGKAIWWDSPFKRIINEWEGQTPILLFNSIGEYLFFYKAVFHLDGALVVKIIENNIQDLQSAYNNYPNESPNWKYIEKTLYGSLLEMLKHS